MRAAPFGLLLAALVVACGGREQATAESNSAGSAGRSGSAGASESGSAGLGVINAGGSSGDMDAAGHGGLAGSAGKAGEALCPSGPSGGSSSCGPTPRAQSMRGSGFAAREGQRVVSQFGETVVAEGNFYLYLGFYGFCGTAAVYRFDTDGDGRCSDGDEVRKAIGGFFEATPDNLGEVASCADFPSGEDLAFEGDARGLGLLRIGLFSGDQTVSDFYLEQFDSFAGSGVAGRLQIGEPYTLRLFSPHLCTCSHLAPTWQQSFVAAAGRNVIELDRSGATSPGPCF